eukprot:3732815-Amphidinium_carterae.1
MPSGATEVNHSNVAQDLQHQRKQLRDSHRSLPWLAKLLCGHDFGLCQTEASTLRFEPREVNGKKSDARALFKVD